MTTGEDGVEQFDNYEEEDEEMFLAGLQGNANAANNNQISKKN